MLQIRNVTVQSKKDGRTLADGLSFALHSGERAALIGEEGNGKSTLLKWIHDPALTAGYAEITGERMIRGKTGYLPQELEEKDKDLSVSVFLEDACGFWSLSPREVAKTAAQLKIPQALFEESRPIGTLSGGERVKVQLAALLLDGSDILLLDTTIRLFRYVC